MWTKKDDYRLVLELSKTMMLMMFPVILVIALPIKYLGYPQIYAYLFLLPIAVGFALFFYVRFRKLRDSDKAREFFAMKDLLYGK